MASLHRISVCYWGVNHRCFSILLSYFFNTIVRVGVYSHDDTIVPSRWHGFFLVIEIFMSSILFLLVRWYLSFCAVFAVAYSRWYSIRKRGL